ncbi:potassium/proton antiporter (CPA1 family) [Algoriphagus aquaeductus]|uniref:Potassium/proton antiporter (CPA1 family) n=1 Tax=Algoriphagus aquaeductus TaxID=475299 RepID=A0A326RK59_9BACT|nr:potassium/proton antiporter [Algoriphagus aquaeductus]PZV77155.1 potassium/proton antiporter (CPA1 family) [Algoriphagus aquaeductus]
MLITPENIILISSFLLIMSIIASKTAGRAGIPVLLLFLGVGMLAGTDGLGKITFNDPFAAQFLGVVALTYILFSGGLDTKWESIKPVMGPGIVLSTLGVLLTALSVGIFATWVGDFSLKEGILLGAIVSSTDAAAVFSILRNKSIGLKGNLRPLLELESGSNDPMAYFLTIGLTTWLSLEGFTPVDLVPLFFKQMILGALAGYGLGKICVFLVNKINLEYEGLYPVLMLGLVAMIYALTDRIGGNGFLAVYLAGITMNQSRILHYKSYIRFFDGVAWLMQIVMFITLGLLVFPSEVLPVVGIGFLIAMFLIFVARPLGVWVSLIFFKYNTREKLFISWVGLRGAVPIVFATFPLIAGIDKSNQIFNIVFFIVIASVSLQATSLAKVAKWLHLAVPERLKRKSLLDIELSDGFKNALVEIVLPQDSVVDGKKILDLSFPKTALIVLVSRNQKYITPNGSTELKSGDQLMIMVNSESEEQKIREVLGII